MLCPWLCGSSPASSPQSEDTQTKAPWWLKIVRKCVAVVFQACDKLEVCLGWAPPVATSAGKSFLGFFFSHPCLVWALEKVDWEKYQSREMINMLQWRVLTKDVLKERFVRLAIWRRPIIIIFSPSGHWKYCGKKLPLAQKAFYFNCNTKIKINTFTTSYRMTAAWIRIQRNIILSCGVLVVLKTDKGQKSPEKEFCCGCCVSVCSSLLCSDISVIDILQKGSYWPDMSCGLQGHDRKWC